MSFWQTSDNENAAQNTGNEFETGGGNIEPIPASTRLKAMIDDAKWDSFQGDEFINLRWTVLAPESYNNRKVFQKVRVLDQDTKKADKAKRMLAAIDANAGGQLAKKQDVPSDMDLASALMNKPMMIEVQVWEMTGDDGQKRSGNWVSKVAPANSSSGTEQHVNSAPSSEKEDDDIPF